MATAQAGIEGLPPLPRGLSGILSSAGGSWREMERLYTKKTMIQEELSRPRPAAGSLRRSRPANLDAALASLRKEMVGLRQLDMSLLCKLWSLYESIQEYKGLYQDMNSSVATEGPFSTENGYYDDDDDEDEAEPAKDVPTCNSLKVLHTQNSRDKWLEDSFHITI
ncbi:leucine repeat adapter protein 25 [Pristis pectinata]|uniref:leucine repeat adapter protein 25 n=1 Tax=Pristis pectinata TaxID=685728 RepID=UPI00223D84DA|nr:leucine repeat adapter protein 25 [Pristis pectinata]